ncbi:MAG: response regulator [Anaerolineae bacterium]|nr:response regulator [Anaerolineae bacterium]
MAGKKRILVAEDEPDIRGLIVFSLQYAGFEVVEASNGQDAVEKAAVVKPDLILLDVRMPKMTGYEACKALKAQAVTKGIPVVFLSARGQESEIKYGLELGAEEYILKPFAPDELYRRVESILQRLGRSGVDS